MMDDAFYSWIDDCFEQGVLTVNDLYSLMENDREALRLLRDFLIDEREAAIAFVRDEAEQYLRMRRVRESINGSIPEEREEED